MGNNARSSYVKSPSREDTPWSSLASIQWIGLWHLYFSVTSCSMLHKAWSSTGTQRTLPVLRDCYGHKVLACGTGEGGGKCIVSFIRGKLRPGVQPMASSLIHGTPFRHRIKLFPSSISGKYVQARRISWARQGFKSFPVLYWRISPALLVQQDYSHISCNRTRSRSRSLYVRFKCYQFTQRRG